jgi:hypothetical protein
VKPAYPKKFALMFFDEFLRLPGVLDHRFSAGCRQQAAGSITNVSGDTRQVQQTHTRTGVTDMTPSPERPDPN